MSVKPPSTQGINESVKNQQEAREQRRREENAKKAKEAAEQLFPDEKWEEKEKGIYQSPHRPTGKKTNYADELRDAQILRDLGSTVYLAPEQRNREGKKYDAIVNGQKMEFKNQHGASVLTLKDHFLDSREQAPNVFINLEKSPLNRRQIMSTLYAARNSEDYAKKSKRFSGGRIILKINGQKNLVYLNVDDLEVPGQ
jgi:hypothetical protein